MFGILKITIAESYKPSDFDLPNDCSKDEFKKAIFLNLEDDPLYSSIKPLIQNYDVIIQEED